MNERSKEYAAALFELAEDASTKKAYLDALTLLTREITAEPAYLHLLSLPSIPLSQRQQLLCQAFGETLPKEVFALARLLCQHREIHHIADCLEAYTELYQAFVGVLPARVVSAVTLQEDEKCALSQKLEALTGRSVAATYETDSDLLGGIKVYINGRVLDGSLRHKLNEIKDVMNR